MPGFIVDGYGTGAALPKTVRMQHLWSIEKLGSINVRDLYAKELGLPKFTVAVEKVKGGAIEYKYASGVTWEDVTVTFYDVQGLLPEIEKWKSSVYNDASGIGASSMGYKQDSRFALIDGQGSVQARYTLKNSWPSQIDHGKLTYTESDAKLVTITLTYDTATMEQV